MNRKKVMYIGIIIILTVILSITYFSYAFFTRQDILDGKLNIVTGTLKYKITSSDLDNNNSIVISANTIKSINIKITSLNDINSKYELYYTSISNNFDIGYSSSSDLPTGTINKNGVKNIVVNVKNKSNSSITLTFGVDGGFINNDLVINGNQISNVLDTVLVSFNANGGSVNPTSLLMIKGSSIGTLPVPTKGNENFLGWYLENTFVTKVSSSYQVNSNIILYAKWDPSLLIYDNGVRYVPLSTQSVWISGTTSNCSEISNSLYSTSVYSGGGCAWYTTNKIDVTNYSTLHIYVKSVTKSMSHGGHVRFGLTNSLTTIYGGAYCADTASQCYTKPDGCGIGTYTNFEKTLDISKYTGSYYLYFPTYANEDSETVYISKIWLD